MLNFKPEGWMLVPLFILGFAGACWFSGFCYKKFSRRKEEFDGSN